MAGSKNQVSQAEFARLIGVNRARVNKLKREGRLSGDGTNVDINTPYAQELLHKSGNAQRAQELEQQKLEAAAARAERRAELELRKIEQQGLNLDIKNRQLRGKLRDAKLQDEAFARLMQALVDRYRGMPPAVLDRIIAGAMKDGWSSRAKSEAMMYKFMDDAAEDIRNEWNALIKSWNSTAVIMSGQDALSD